MNNDNKELIKTNDPEFLKDPNSGALVSNNIRAFNKFKLKEEQTKKIKIHQFKC